MNTSTPDISIVIPLYNRESLIKETLDSILAQTFQNWECIIVDDGSIDDSWNVVVAYASGDPRIECLKRPENLQKGANTCRNFGFSKAKGTYVQWFDSDDVMLPKKLALELAAIQKSQADYCISLARLTDQHLQKNELIRFQFDNNASVFKNYAMGNIEVVTQMVLWRKDFLKGKELFKPFIKRGQETELYSRLFFESNNCSRVEYETLLYRQHADSKTNKNRVEYIPSYKYSQAYVALQFMKLGQQNNDSAILKRYYRFCVHYLYEASIFKDKKTISLLNNGLDKLETALKIKRKLKRRLGTMLIILYGKKAERLRKWFLSYEFPKKLR